MKEGYKPVDDILEEVAKEEGLSLKEVKDIWNHQKVFVKKQMDAEGVYAIFLPYIGTLSLNVKQYSKEIRGRIRGLYKIIVNKVSKLKKDNSYTKNANAHKRVTGVNRLAKKIIKDYNTGTEQNSNLVKINKCWDIIAKYSNGVYEKKTNK